MNLNELQFPIPYHLTWDIIDSSKLEEYMTCPRKFFYRYMLGWRPTTPNNHLEFGQAWHLAMEHLLLNGYEASSITDAYGKFEEYYRTIFDESTDELYFPKTPERALSALVEYCSNYPNDLLEFKVHYTEISATVPVAENRVIHLRMDSIVEDSNGIFSLEHKTAGRAYLFPEKWPLSVAVGTYTHAMNCLYSPEQVHGVKINGSVFKRIKGDKNNFEFIRVPCWRTNEQMQDWLWMVLHYMDLIQYNCHQLSQCSPSDNVMMCFQKNPTSCLNYNRTCEYYDFCTTWANPLRECEFPPMGFRFEYWNPSDRPATHELEIKS